MKKIAIFSDIHGNLEALHSILSDIQSKDFDEIIYLGDAISVGPEPKECLELLKKSNVRFLLGNHELYYLYGTAIDEDVATAEYEAHYEWIKSLLDKSDEEYLKRCKLYYELNINNENLHNKKILFAHFLIKNINEPYPFEDIKLKHDINQWLIHNNKYDYIFIGHEHDIYSQDDVQGVGGDFEKSTGLLSNIWLAGSSGCTKDNITFYTSLEIEKSISVTRIYLPYDRDTFLKKKCVDYPKKIV